MTLRMAFNEKSQIFEPRFVCDFCGMPIDDAKNGNALWDDKYIHHSLNSENPDWAATSGLIFHTHKQCDHSFENATLVRGWPLPFGARSPVAWSWEELRLSYLQLGYNSSIVDKMSFRTLREGRSITVKTITKIKAVTKIIEVERYQGTNLAQRFRIFKRDNYRCQICGRSAPDGARLEVDHKTPRAAGGSNDDENLWTLCFDCNRGKRDEALE